MGNGHCGHGELRARRDGNRRREETADAEACDGRNGAAEYAGEEDEDESTDWIGDWQIRVRLTEIGRVADRIAISQHSVI